MGDPARRLDDRAAGRRRAGARVPAAGAPGVRAGGSHRGWWRMVEVVEDGGGRDEATSTNLHEPPEPPPTSAGGRSVNPRPSQICGELLAALDASEGRRRRRKRDTTPDAIGLTIKRDLLERAVAADPEADAFEAWLHEQCLAAGGSEGGVRAMALSIFEEWRLAHDADAFRDWLARGAPSDDALTARRRGKE